MNIDIVQEQASVPVTIFRLGERINLGNAEQLEQKAREAFAEGTRNLLMDLTNVPSMTSVGLRAILIIYKLLESRSAPASKEIAEGKTSGITQKSAHLKLLNPNQELRCTLNMVGFDMYIEIFDNEQEALLAF